MPDTAKLPVLVVDDDPSTRNLFSVLLQSHGCETARTAGNGAEGVALFKETPVGLVLLDVEMPVMNGLDALKEIMAVDANATVVMLTAVDDKSVADDCILAGARDFIRKNLGLEAIHTRLGEVLAKINA